jgi:glycosyltransferase involved in cell wall biosynthesis
VLWTFTPVTYGLELDADIVVYHCVDLLARFPGIDGKAVARGERDLAGRASVAIATSTEVRDHLVRTGFPHVLLLPNVADVSVFSRASQPSADRRPAVLFAGNLSPHKLDVALLESIAQSLRGQADLLLAGPLGAGGGDFGPALQGLRDLGASYLGVLTLPELAGIAGTCTVGLIPYALNAYTRGVSPLKCFEYLASGLGVVGTRIPEVERLAATNPHVHALDAADIPAQVLRLLAPAPDQVIEARVAAATGNGWDERGSVLRDLLTTRLSEWSRR